MDKLTWYDEDGRLYCRRGYEVALARLASYEATELMPDEIVKMGMMFEDSKRYSGRLELKLNAATKRMPKWVSVKERLPEDRSLERCVFCGQRFLPDALTEEWSKPPEEVRMDCPSCGGKSTMVGARARSNGHFHGQCTVCGCVVME